MTNPICFKYLNDGISIKGYSQNDWIVKHIERCKNFYEIELLEYIKFVLKNRKGLILDVGANIGNHSIYFGKFTGCSVASFEPNPSVIPILEENLADNNLPNKVYKFGLGSSEGRYEVDIPQEMLDNVGAARLKATETGVINVKKLDDIQTEIIEDFKNLSIVAIKADIEGMEPEMLEGSIQTIEKFKPELFLEINSSDSMEKIEGILYPLGYAKIISWAASPVWHFTNRKHMSVYKITRIAVYFMVKKLTIKAKRAFGFAI